MFCTAYLGRDAQGTRLENCRQARQPRSTGAAALCRLGTGVLQGSLGTSLKRDKPINDLVATRMRNTAVLALGAAVIGIPLAIFLGVIAALRRTVPRCAISGGSIFALTIPNSSPPRCWC